MRLYFLLFAHSKCGLNSLKDLSGWIPVSTVEIAMVTITCMEEMRGYHDNGILHAEINATNFIFHRLPSNLAMISYSPITQFDTGPYWEEPHTVETLEKMKDELSTVLNIIASAVSRSKIPVPPELKLCLLFLEVSYGLHGEIISSMRRLLPAKVPRDATNTAVDLKEIDEYLRELTRTDLLVLLGQPARVPLIMRSVEGARYWRSGRSLGFSRNRLVFPKKIDRLIINREIVVLRRLSKINGVSKLVTFPDGFSLVMGRTSDVSLSDVDWSKWTESELASFTVNALCILRDIHNAGFVYGFIEESSFILVKGLREIRMVNFGAATTWLDPYNTHTRLADVFELLSLVFQMDSERRMNSSLSCFGSASDEARSRNICSAITQICNQVMEPTYADTDPEYARWIAMFDEIV